MTVHRVPSRYTLTFYSYSLDADFKDSLNTSLVGLFLKDTQLKTVNVKKNVLGKIFTEY